jgi:hypothetical protein
MLTPGGRVLQDGSRVNDLDGTENHALPKTRKPSCDDCFFMKNHLCALKLDGPCPTFRPAERGLAPERQLAFVFRAERTTAAYAFPQPTA